LKKSSSNWQIMDQKENQISVLQYLGEIKT